MAQPMVIRREFVLEVSTSPVDNIRAIRTLCSDKGWQMRRHEGARMVDRFAIIMPMTQSAATLGLELLDGPLSGMEVHSWAETKGSAGAVNKTGWTIPGGIDNPEAVDLIQEWALSLPRCPWKWTFGEKSKVGFLLPVWRRSRKAFAKLGLKEWNPQESENL